MTPTDLEVAELPSSPGARLRREREARGMTEQQAAETLTLDPSVVLALETNDFAALGAPVFVKGHLRRYATLLGVPEDEVLGAYERSKQHMAEPSLVPKSRLDMLPVRGRPKWPWVLGGLVAFVVAALVTAYVAEKGLPWFGGEVATEASDTPASGPAGNAGLPETAPAPSASSYPAAAPVTPAASDGPEDANAAPASGTAGASAATAGTVPPAVMAPGQVRLQLRFSGDSWVEVFDGSGRAVLYDLGKSGTERTLTASAPLSVTLGNAAFVKVAINGKAVAAPRQAGQVMARFSVGPDGSLR